MRIHRHSGGWAGRNRCKLCWASVSSGQRIPFGTDLHLRHAQAISTPSSLSTHRTGPQEQPRAPTAGSAQGPGDTARSPLTDTAAGSRTDPAAGAAPELPPQLLPGLARATPATRGPGHGGPTKAGLGAGPLRVPPSHSPEDAQAVPPPDTEFHPPRSAPGAAIAPQSPPPPVTSPLSAAPGRVRRDRGRERRRACAQSAAAAGPGARTRARQARRARAARPRPRPRERARLWGCAHCRGGRGL